MGEGGEVGQPWELGREEVAPLKDEGRKRKKMKTILHISPHLILN